MFSKEILGLIAGTFTTIAFVPQVYKTWKTKSAKDVSMHMFILFGAGVVLWIIYGLYNKILSVALTNIAILILASIQIFLKIKYDSNQRKS
ncbi:MAG: SemiSWEET transporter [Endomicrobia bacterium]|nr:SemiSWEET transporter [Endomicrobiia bacterium]